MTKGCSSASQWEPRDSERQTPAVGTADGGQEVGAMMTLSKEME